MKTIRQKTFETNSSSTHSITIMSKDDFQRWEDGEIFKEPYNDNFIEKDEVGKYLKDYYEENKESFAKYNDITEFDAEVVEESLRNDGEMPEAYEDYCESDYLEVDVNNHTTKNGEDIVIICKYGRDG